MPRGSRASRRRAALSPARRAPLGSRICHGFAESFSCPPAPPLTGRSVGGRSKQHAGSPGSCCQNGRLFGAWRPSWSPVSRFRACPPNRRPGARGDAPAPLQPAHGGGLRQLDVPLLRVPRPPRPGGPRRRARDGLPQRPGHAQARRSVHAEPGAVGAALSLPRGARARPPLARRARPRQETGAPARRPRARRGARRSLANGGCAETHGDPALRIGPPPARVLPLAREGRRLRPEPDPCAKRQGRQGPRDDASSGRQGRPRRPSRARAGAAPARPDLSQ